MKSLLSRSSLLLAMAVACMGTLAPAHARIGVGTQANCFDGLNNYNYSWTGQQPYQAEWTFAMSQTSYTAAGPKTVPGWQFIPGFLTATLYFAPSFPVYQAVGNHFGSDGYAYYAVTTSASSCNPGDVRIFQSAGKASSADSTLGTLDSEDAAAIASTGAANAEAAPAMPASRGAQAMLATRGARIGSIAQVWSASEHRQAQKLWAQRAADATSSSVAHLLGDAQQASFESAVARGSDRLAFVAAQVGSTELSKAGLAKSLSGGARGDSGWSGYTRVYRTGATEWVMLDEMDLNTMQASAVIFQEVINADVNGAPALLRSARGSGGTNLTTLTWIANGKRYGLKTNAAPAKASERLLAIARGLY